MRTGIKAFAAAAAVMSVLSAGEVRAVNFGSGNLNSIADQATIDSIMEFVTEGTAHRGFHGANPLGMAFGLQLTADASYFKMPAATKAALQQAAGPGSSVPDQMVVPRLSLRKGLPMNIDFGVSLIPVPIEGVKLFSVEAQWAPIAMPQGLNIAGRLSYSSSTIVYIEATTFAVEGLASFKMGPLEPYLGLGMNFSSGKLNVPVASLNASVTAESSFVNPKFQAGLNIGLPIIKLGLLYEHNFAGFDVLGLSAGLGF